MPSRRFPSALGNDISRMEVVRSDGASRCSEDRVLDAERDVLLSRDDPGDCRRLYVDPLGKFRPRHFLEFQP